MSGSGTGEDAVETAEEGSESGLGRILDDSGEFDVEATNEEARSVLANWRRDDYRTAEERMRRLTVFGIGAVLALFIAPAESSTADSVVTAALWTLIPATAVVGCLARTLRETESADDLLTGDAGVVYAVAVTALVVAGHAAGRGPVGRALWRFLFRSAPFSPDPMPGVRTRGRRGRAGGHVGPARGRGGGNRRRRRHGVGSREAVLPGWHRHRPRARGPPERRTRRQHLDGRGRGAPRRGPRGRRPRRPVAVGPGLTTRRAVSPEPAPVSRNDRATGCAPFRSA